MHRVGQFGDDDVGLPPADVLQVDPGLGDDAPSSRFVGGADGVYPFARNLLPEAIDHATGGKVGAGDDLHKFVYGDLAAFLPAPGHMDDGVANFAQVVGWDVGRHAYGDARRAVKQQVGQRCRKNGRFLQAAIEIVHEINGVLVNVLEHVLRDLGQSGLGVAHSRGAVAVDGSPVALAVHQWVAHRKVLAHADHGHVDRLVTVGMVLAQGFAHHTGGLFVGPLVAQAHVVHGVQDTPLYRLEPILDPGQRPVGDRLHRIFKVCLLQVCGQGNLFNGNRLSQHPLPPRRRYRHHSRHRCRHDLPRASAPAANCGAGGLIGPSACL